MKMFSIEPERRKWTKWVLAGAALVTAAMAGLLFLVAAVGCASAPQSFGYRATLRIEVEPQKYGNRPRRVYEVNASDSTDPVPGK